MDQRVMDEGAVPSTAVHPQVMGTDKNNIAQSALYTSGTWQWARLPEADLVTPANAAKVFRMVNRVLVIYRWINPQVYSLRHQLLHRHTAIDHLRADSGCTRTVEVACGFSPRGAHVSGDPAQEYVEIDLPAMVAHKRAQLARTPRGQSVLARPNLHLMAEDVRQLDFAGRFGDRPTAVITEGLMMYFQREQQLPIWRSIAELVNQSNGVYLFDYIPLSEEHPRSFFGRMLHYLRIEVFKLKGDFAYDARTRSGIEDDLRACGFEDVTSYSTGDIAQSWHLPEAHVPSRTIIYRCRRSQTNEVSA